MPGSEIKNNPPVLSLVIPCYNEAAGLADSINSVLLKLQQLLNDNTINENSFILFIDDGSKDATWNIITKYAGNQVKGLKLSNNVGHQKALIAGLHYAVTKCDCSITIDADLQDDMDVIDAMIMSFIKGNQVVYGVRNNRDVDSIFKKKTAQLFYTILKWMKIDIIYNHADFRLAGNKVLIELKRYEETHMFLRGIFPLMGFKSDTIYYQRKDRQQGRTNYSLSKMIRLAIDGVTSFSAFPLKLITITGFVVFTGCIFAIIWVIVVMMLGRNIPGWSSITLPMYFLGGIQLLSLGILGEYVNKIFQETKKRPLYHIEEFV
ncbi:MAG: glycosyltransferase family 2 protein [Ginsengibacter sp.]